MAERIALLDVHRDGQRHQPPQLRLQASDRLLLRLQPPGAVAVTARPND